MSNAYQIAVRNGCASLSSNRPDNLPEGFPPVLNRCIDLPFAGNSSERDVSQPCRDMNVCR